MNIGRPRPMEIVLPSASNRPTVKSSRLVDDHVVGGAHQVGLHLVGDGDDRVADDLGGERVHPILVAHRVQCRSYSLSVILAVESITLAPRVRPLAEDLLLPVDRGRKDHRSR